MTFDGEPKYNPDARGKVSVEQSVTQFIDTICEQPAEGIPGEMVQRIAGNFSIKNSEKKDIAVYFCGTTHDVEGEIGGKRIVTDAEKAFIDTHLQRAAATCRTVVCESGTQGNEVNSIFPVVRRVFEADLRGREILPQIDRANSNYDIDLNYAGRRAKHMGLSVINADLHQNLDALPYFLEIKGAEDMIRKCIRYTNLFCPSEAENFLFKELHPTIVWELIKASNLEDKIDRDFCDRVVRDEIEDPKAEFPTNEERDQFMADNIQRQDSDIFFIAHTRHVLGIMHNLRERITSFHPTDIEISEGRMEDWKNA